MAAKSMQSCVRIDDTFGPYARRCRGGFDFTLLFEESMLTILPLGLLLVAAPFRSLFLYTKKTKVVQSPLLPLKLASFAIFAGLQLALLVFWAKPSTVKTRTSIPAAVLSLVGALTFSLLSYTEHVRSVRPSFLLNVFLFITLLFDAAHARTLWLLPYDRTIAIVFTSATGVKAAILLLEAVEKRGILLEEYRSYPPEATSGIYNRSFFWWLNELFRRGFGKLLFLEDLFALDKKLASEYLQGLLQSAWEKVTNKSPYSLMVVTMGRLKWPLMAVIPWRAALIAFSFCQPFLINRAIKLSTEPVTAHTTDIGYGLIGAYVLVYTGIAITTGQYQHLTYRAITMMRGGLVSMLYSKTTDLSISAVDPATALTLMSADIERITTGWQSMHEVWANMIEIGIAIWLLKRQLGAACAIPVAVAILSMVGSIAAISLVMSRQAMWLEAIEKRIAATTAMLGAIKGVKMCGLTDTLSKNLQALRVDELRISKKFRKLLIWNMAFAYITPVVAPILTFAVFSILSRKNGTATLDTARVFTSLSLFALLSEPLGSLIMSAATFMGSVGCFQRIQEFLDTDVRHDSRQKSPELLIDELCRGSRDMRALSQGSDLGVEMIMSAIKGDRGSLAGGDALTVYDGSFGWDKEKDPILKGITMAVPRGKLTMLVGPVGCGKSTLLKALLGEVPAMSGSVHVAALEVAYCDQTPWHMNGTVQQSILGVEEFDRLWYSTVVRACALDEDLRQLVKGDQTLIGSKGIALSGGQSQRIALARAIYAKKSVVILDDVLSGLDADTENRVFHNLLGRDGLLRAHRSTVLIASSAAKRLPYADHIVALDANGTISEQGTFEDLSQTGGYVSSFTLPEPDWDYTLEDKEATDAASPTEYFYCPPDPNALTEGIEAEASRRTGDIAIYLYYIRSIGWGPTMIFVGAITAFVFCISFPNIWVKWWAQANSIRPNYKLGYYIGIYVLLGCLALFFLIVSCWQMIITMVPKSGENFHWTLLKTVLSAPMSFFSMTDTGITINRFSQDLQLIDMELPVAALNTFATFILCIAQIALISIASVYAAIAVPVCIIVLYYIQKFYLRTSRQLRFMDLEAKSPLYSQFVECLSGLATVRAFGWQKALEKKNRELLDRSQRPFYLLFAVQRWLTLVLDLVVAAIAVLLIVLVVKLRGTLSAGYVGIALLNVIMFSQSIKLLVTFWTTLETHIGAIARIKIFTDSAVPEDLPIEKEMPPSGWPSSGAIEFKSVSAAYKVSEPVVKDVSLSIEAGQKVGICGRTGSGKSSLILSVFRMIEFSHGSITIDGLDISRLPRQEVRSRIIGVPQDAYLLPGTVRLNADPVAAVSDEAIVEALKSVQLWEAIHEKGGLDTDIEQVFLSHGQKQLFCLARAMLRSSTVLILDEATSSVDGKTDELMQRVIREHFSSHTVIAVAHKLDAILDFDKIVLLDGGRLVECDTPEALLSRDSAFRKLYNSIRAETVERVEKVGVVSVVSGSVGGDSIESL